MKRQVYTSLLAWKNLPPTRRKPLILEGARQTGKTWLARELGKREFDSFVEVNFEQMTELRPLFETNFDLNRILMSIQAFAGKKIEPGKTLLFFDEIQFARRGLLSLKSRRLGTVRGRGISRRQSNGSAMPVLSAK